MDYLQYYDLESYLFDTVRKNFHDNDEISAFDFFCIIIWKANRAKSIMAKKLLRMGDKYNLHTLDEIVKEISSNLAKLNLSDKEKLSYLIETWEFRLPMASAVLTILFPEDFTVYDIGVCEELNFTYSLSQRKFENLWKGYQEFIQKVKDATPAELSLRDKDRYLLCKSFHNQLKNDIKNKFGINSL